MAVISRGERQLFALRPRGLSAHLLTTRSGRPYRSTPQNELGGKIVANTQLAELMDTRNTRKYGSMPG
jgi:hypothetical protein